jgi:hypothetical protein
MTKHCLITEEPITPENDTKAHVLPSAVGGRLRPRGILSKNGNNLLGDKIDLPLIQAFQSLMNLLNGSRDRGQNRPTPMTDESGKVFIFKFGEPLSLAQPEYNEAEVDGNTHIVIKACNLKEVRTLLGRAKARYPGFDIDVAMAHAVLEHQWPPDTFYFMPAKRWISTSAEVAHIVTLIGDAAAGRMLVYVELFSFVCIGVLLPFDGTQDVCETYAVDVLTGQEVPVSIDQGVVRSIPWAATHQLGDASLLAFTKTKLEELVRLAQRREWTAVLDQIINRAFGPANGRRLMPRDYAKLIGEVVQSTITQWKHPAIDPAARQQQLLQFDALCAQFQGRLPFFARCWFRHLIARHRATLAKAVNG